jgi:hypothetical protein
VHGSGAGKGSGGEPALKSRASRRWAPPTPVGLSLKNFEMLLQLDPRNQDAIDTIRELKEAK